MTRKILFAPEAEAELAEAVDWYEARRRGLGADYLRTLDATLANIEHQPMAYPVLFGTARRAVMRRFPFSIIFTLNDDEIMVLACFHASRDPKKWKARV
jgi:plasmid stabilization system protein ParE